MPRRFPAPWSAERIPGGFVVKDSEGQALAYVYARENEKDASTREGAHDGRGSAHCRQYRQAAGAFEAIS
jgi:hypothetical protein